MHGHLRGTVDLESRIDLLDEPDNPDVLYNGCVDPAIDRLAQKSESVFDLAGLDQGVECQIDAGASRVREPARDFQLIERELRALVAGIVSLRAEVNGISPVGDGGSHSIERARRR